MIGRFLVDECLVAVAKARGYDADYVPHIGKGGWRDRNLVPFAVDNDYIVVPVNRRDFLKQHARLHIHPGLVILLPEPENDGRLADGSVQVREWNAAEHDIGHINNPKRP